MMDLRTDGTFRVRADDEVEVLDGVPLPEGFRLTGGLDDAFVVLPAASLEDGGYPYGEWYCDSTGCVVREVQVYAKPYGEAMPAKIKCPVCRKDLKFHHWLRVVELRFTPDPAPETQNGD